MSNPIPTHVRAAVYERDGMCCLRCGTYVGGDSQGRSIHHRQPRGMGGSRLAGTHRLSLLVLLCGSGTTGCHGWIESHRTDALAQGWLISKFEAADPQTIPLRWDDTDTATCLLDDGQKITDLAGSPA